MVKQTTAEIVGCLFFVLTFCILQVHSTEIRLNFYTNFKEFNKFVVCTLRFLMHYFIEIIYFIAWKKITLASSMRLQAADQHNIKIKKEREKHIKIWSQVLLLWQNIFSPSLFLSSLRTHFNIFLFMRFFSLKDEE